MSDLRAVLDDFRRQGVVEGGQILLPPARALQLVHAFESRGISIRGVARFEQTGDRLREHRPYGFVDRQGADAVATVNAARDFISAWASQDDADLVAVHFDYAELARPLEQRVLPMMRSEATAIQQEFPWVNATVESFPVGGRTWLQGWDFYIDCLIPSVPDDESENVALGISVKHLPTVPNLSSANVVWGHPSGAVEAEVSVDGLPADEEALAHVEAAFPLLSQGLKRAFGRGKPPGEGPLP